MNTRGIVLTAVAIAALLLSSPLCAPAQTTLFFDDFNGPTLNPLFQPSLPDAPLGSGGGNLTYLGAPSYSFGTADGATVLRITDTMNNRQRFGWNTNAAFNASDFRLEIRFNSLVQSPATSIDSFIEGWLIDTSNPSRFLFAGPHGQNFGTLRQFRAGSSIGGQYVTQSFNWLDNTWYKLVITGGSSQNIRASIFADNGTTELIGQAFNFNGSTFPSGFEIGLSQATGVPNGNYPVDVAIDYLRLTTSAVPEPSSGVLLVFGVVLGGITLLRRRLKQLLRSIPVLAVVFVIQCCALSIKADIITFGSDTTWSTSDASNNPIGNAQYVLLSPTSPTRRPAGATVYQSSGGGWTADLSPIPNAYWIWAPGITGATTNPALAKYSFSKQFNLAGTPVSGTISVAVDDYAAVFLNGSMVGETGSVTDGPLASAAQSALKTFNLSSFLMSGSNTLTVVGQNGPFGNPTNYGGDPAGVVFGGSFQFQVLPEPPSGALILLGAGLLSLQKKIASQ